MPAHAFAPFLLSVPLGWAADIPSRPRASERDVDIVCPAGSWARHDDWNDGRVERWCEDGKVLATYRCRDDSGAEKECVGQRGRRAGPYRFWSKFGDGVVVGQYVDDHKSGLWRHYDGEFVDQTGAYNPDGTLCDFVEFWPSGAIHHEGRFERGNYTGVWREFREDGTLETEGDLTGRDVKKLRCYDPAGAKKTCPKYAEYEVYASPWVGTANDR